MSIYGGVSTTQNSNIPSILTTAGTALVANQARIGFSIQNVGMNPVYVLLGAGASASVYHFVLKGGTADNDGLGGSITFTSGIIFTGEVSFAGTTPKIVCLEIAP